jgi:hypothetical protein
LTKLATSKEVRQIQPVICLPPAEGRRTVIRILTIVDDCRRSVRRSPRGRTMCGVECWIGMAIERGPPEALLRTTGRSFGGPAACSEERGLRLVFIQPGRPVQNGYIESFAGGLREGCLKTRTVTSLSDPRKISELVGSIITTNNARGHRVSTDRKGDAGTRKASKGRQCKRRPLLWTLYHFAASGRLISRVGRLGHTARSGAPELLR